MCPLDLSGLWAGGRFPAIRHIHSLFLVNGTGLGFSDHGQWNLRRERVVSGGRRDRYVPLVTLTLEGGGRKGSDLRPARAADETRWRSWFR